MLGFGFSFFADRRAAAPDTALLDETGLVLLDETRLSLIGD